MASLIADFQATGTSRSTLHMLIVFAALAGTSTLAAAANDADETAYSIAMNLAVDGQIIGMPTLLMPIGSAGTATVEGKYSLQAALLSEDPRYGSEQPGDLSLEFELMLPVNGRWTRVAAPSLRLFLASTATIHLDISGLSIPSASGSSLAKSLEISAVAMKHERDLPVLQESICTSSPREGDMVSPEPEARTLEGQAGTATEDRVCCRAGFCTCSWSGSGGCCYDGINCPSGCCVITP